MFVFNFPCRVRCFLPVIVSIFSMNSSLSLFEQAGYQPSDIAQRLQSVWAAIFEGSHKFYWQNRDGLGYVMDTGNSDVRTEGMSYAMMLAVQFDRQDIFDRLWAWAKKYMWISHGRNAGYFAWSCTADGKHNSEGPAPDGEEYFAAALFLTERRWGSRTTIPEGIVDHGNYGNSLQTEWFHYADQARAILYHCVHKGEKTSPDLDGRAMWDPTNHLIRFIPEVDWTDPSYHLPHFYTLFAQEADECDRDFWREAADASRSFLAHACDSQTGLNPEYANFDGSAHRDERDHWHFFSDAYRTAANIGLDAALTGPDPVLVDRVAHLQQFLLTHDRTAIYSVDGTPLVQQFHKPGDEEELSVLHPVGLIATTAQGSLATFTSSDPAVRQRALEWVRLLWDTPLRVGSRRYYDNNLYALAFLALSGNYRLNW